MQCCPCAPHFISPREGWNMLRLKVMCPISVQASDKFIAPLTIYNLSEPCWCGLCYLSCSGAATLMMLRLWGAWKISTVKIQQRKKTCLLHMSVCVVWLKDKKQEYIQGQRHRSHRGAIKSLQWMCTFLDWSSCWKPAPTVGTRNQQCLIPLIQKWTHLFKPATGDISLKHCEIFS